MDTPLKKSADPAAMEAELRQSHDLYRTLAESSPEMVYLLDPDGVVRYVNKAGLAMFPAYPGGVIGKRVRDIFPSAQAARHLEAIARVLKSGAPVHSEVESVFPAGKRWIDARLTPVRDKSGAITGVLGLSQDITVRKNAEAALRASEEKYRTLTEKMNTGVMMVTLDGRFVHVNRAVAEIGGYTSTDDFYSTPASSFYENPDDRKTFVAAVLEKGSVRGFEVRLKRKDGSGIWASMDAVVLKDGEGKPTHILTCIQDISEKKNREELLIIQHDMGTALSAAKTIADGLRICLDAAIKVSEMDCGGIYLVNDGDGALELCHHSGLSARFVEIGAHYPPGSPNNNLVMNGKPVYANYLKMPQPFHREGEQDILRAIAIIPFCHEGRVIGCLNIASHALEEMPAQSKVVLEIIANQIGGEVGWLVAQDTLRKSEERYRSIVENINDAMIIHDFTGTVLEVNENSCLMHGYARTELIGMHLSALCGAEDARLVKQRLTILIETGTLVFDGEHLRRDRSPFAINVSARVVSRDGKGVVQSFVRDISAIRKMEAELGKKEKLEALGILAGGIAHDFNNLLSGVFGFMDLARMSMKPGDEALDYLTKAFTGFERAKHLSQQLLTFSKGGSPVKRVLSIMDVVKDCGELALSGSNTRIAYEFAKGLSAVEADLHQLSQVFSNLLINARQAMPDGGTITITAENRHYDGAGAVPLPAGPYVTIALRDEGVGIPDKIIGRIFDPFFTTKQQGSGLGLSICFSIVKKHGGHITVSSAPGEGAVFTVWLPSAGKSVPDAAEQADFNSLKGRGRILVMDDEPPIREMAAIMLKSAGYEVATVADGERAIEKYREASAARAPFDLVILDLTVPGGMGGEKTIVELLKINPKITAIVSSGYADNSLITNFKAHGFAGMIAKPYTAGDLLRVVKKTLGIGKDVLP